MSDRAIVIGAGVIGAAVADALSADGMQVLVIDAGTPGGGVTSAGMGHVVVMDDSPAQLELTSWSLALLDRMAAELPPSCELNRCGTLWIADDAEQLAAAHVKAARYTAAGISAEVIDSHALASAEPHLRAGLAGAVHVPGDSVIRPPALCGLLLERAVRRGARIVADTPVVRVEANTVITGSGSYSGDVIVNAAGIDAARLSPGLSILPRKGHLVMCDAGGELCRHQLVEIGYMRSAHDLDRSSVAFNVQPRRTGRVVIGSSRELSVGDPAIEPAIVNRMLERAAMFMPRIAQLPRITTWTGLRPATADGLPLIGRWEAQPGVWIAAGHEGLGTTTALATANLLADLIRERTPAIDAAPYVPRRASAVFESAVRAQSSLDVLATSNRMN